MLRHPLHEQKYYLHKRIILHGGMSDTLPDHKEFSYNVQLSCDVEIVLHQTVMVRERCTYYCEICLQNHFCHLKT